MKNIFKRSRFWITAAIIVFLLAGCDNDSDDNTHPIIPPDITVEVRINSSSSAVLRGGEVSFLASVRGTDNKNVTWSIDEDNRHLETEINTNAAGETFLSVAEDETLGTLTVRATSTADPEKSGTVTVTIPVPTVDKVEISLAEPWVVPWQWEVDTGTGGEVEFTVKVTGRNFIREAVSWSIDDEGKHENTTINIDNGVARLHVAQTETLTSFKVQAVSKWDTGKIGEVTVTVKEPTVIGVVILDQDGKIVPDGSIAKPSKQIKTSSTESFRALVTGTGKVDQNVTWEIERLTYIISILDIRLDKNNQYSEAWGSTSLEISIFDNEVTEENTWYCTGEETDDYFLIYIPMPIEYDSDTGGIKIWDTDGFGENEQKILRPTTGTTGIDETGKFTADGQETFGKFRLTAVSTADATKKREIIIQIDTSSDINIDIPEV